MDQSLGKSVNWVESLFVISPVTDQQTQGHGDDRVRTTRQAAEKIHRLRAAVTWGKRASTRATLQPGQILGRNDLLCKSKAPTVSFCSVGVGVCAHM